MANTVAVIMGALFILIGLAGFVFDNLLGAHLTLAHNLIHLVSGAASLLVGWKGSRFAAKMFCCVFGLLYLSLGIVGYWFGYYHNASYLPDHAKDGGVNENMFWAIPGVLELGTIDHLIHFAIAAIYLVAATLTKTRRTATEYLEGNPG